MKSPDTITIAKNRYAPLPQDVVVAALALTFAVLSFVFPHTGPSPIAALARGQVMGCAFLAVAALAALAPLVGEGAPKALRFLRLYFPQALLVLFFQESILLSVELFRGRAFDDLIANMDKAIFGFQPSRWFHRALDSIPPFNELMFGSYALYYLFFAVTPWLPFFAGDTEGAERRVFVIVCMMAIIFVWYLFFRVEGPKYWFPDLRAADYAQFSGGLFVRFFQDTFRSLPLYGAAFPSTHVAFTLLMTIFAARSDRRLLWVYIPGCILVGCATVYLYAHYFTDVLGGIVATAALEPLLWRLYPAARRLLRRPAELRP